jgi:hypothetical protein
MSPGAILLLAIGASLYGQSDAPKSGEVTFEFVFSGGQFPLAGRLIIDSEMAESTTQQWKVRQACVTFRQLQGYG